jgi:DNA-binding NtrC family response regulator
VLSVPPLRSRRAEIEPLAQAFAQQAARDLGRPEPFTFTPAALARITGHDWPGNVRELRNAIERAALLSDGPMLDAGVFDFELAIDRDFTPEPSAAPPPGALDDERARISAALASCAGNQTRAAAMLGMARRTLVKKLARYNLPRPRKSSTVAD